MIDASIRYLLLWCCRVLGAVYSLLERKLVFHLVLLLGIAGGLWFAERVFRVGTAGTVEEVETAPTLAASAPTPATHREEGAADGEGRTAPQPHESASGQAVKPDAPKPAKGGSEPGVRQTTPNPTTLQPAEPKAAIGSGPPDESRTGRFGWLRHRVARWVPPKPAGESWVTSQNVLSIWAFGLVVWWIVRARRRLVIGTFEDFTEKKAGVDAGGFGVLLAVELSRLSDLFNEVEAGRLIQATPEERRPLNAAFETEASGAFLEKAISAKAEFSLGLFKIPVGIIAGLFGRLVQGPRIGGQLHLDGSQRIVTMSLVGSLGERVWRVLERASGGEPGKEVWRPTADLAHDLACRIFAEVVMGRAVTWQALKSFVAGVRAYRQSVRIPKQRKLNLRDAERRLIEALAEDPSFDLGYYNLGIVYTELGQLDAAARAFQRAVEENDQRWSPYYALAVINNALPRFETDAEQTARLYLSSAIGYCDRALRLTRSPAAAAQILDLKAIVLWRHAWLPSCDQLTQNGELRAVRTTTRRAVWKGWWALSRSELGVGIPAEQRARTRERLKAAACRYLENRASMYREIARIFETQVHPPTAAEERSRKRSLRQATRDLRQACSLTPSLARLHFVLGMVHLERGLYALAVRALHRAVLLPPTSPDVFAYLALALAHRDCADLALEASERLLENVDGASPESLKGLAAAMERLKQLFMEIEQIGTQLEPSRKTADRPFAYVAALRRRARCTYRLAQGRLGSLKAAREQVDIWLRERETRLALIARCDEIAKRAEELAGSADESFADKVEALEKKGEQGIAPLQTLLCAKLAASYHWEVGHIGHRLGLLHLTLERLDEAEGWVRATIAYLERSLRVEIPRRDLHALLSFILRRKGDLTAALDMARQGVALDPVNSSPRNQLGWAHYGLAEYAFAQSAWEDALGLSPEDPDLHVNLAFVFLAQLGDSKSKADRSQLLEQTTRQLNAALDLLEHADRRRDDARYWLGKAHSAAGRYADALREFRALDRSDYCNLFVALQLAEAHFSNKDWGEAERRFRGAADEADKAIAGPEGVNASVDVPPGEGPTALGMASAWAHVGIAASFLEREISIEQALAEIGRARSALADLRDEEQRRRGQQACDLSEGMVLLRRGRADEAIDRFEAALAVDANARTYLELASALARKAELTEDADLKSSIVQRATRCYRDARELDWTGDFETRIAAGLQQTEAMASRRAGANT